MLSGIGLLALCGAILLICILVFSPAEPQPRGTNSTGITARIAYWRTYTDPTGGFTLSYPAIMATSTRSASQEDGSSYRGTALSLSGPTQEPGTPLTDGISIFMRVQPLQSTLEAFAEQEAESVFASPEGIAGTLQPITHNGVEGYTFSAHAVVPFTNLILPLTDTQVLVISYTTPDPTAQGFSELADTILASLHIPR